MKKERAKIDDRKDYHLLSLFSFEANELNLHKDSFVSSFRFKGQPENENIITFFDCFFGSAKGKTTNIRWWTIERGPSRSPVASAQIALFNATIMISIIIFFRSSRYFSSINRHCFWRVRFGECSMARLETAGDGEHTRGRAPTHIFPNQLNFRAEWPI